MPATYGFVSINILSKCPVPFIICSHRYGFANIGVLWMYCVACDQSACLCHPQYVWLLTVNCAVALCSHSVHPLLTILHCTATVAPTGKENESLVALPFTYLSCLAFRASKFSLSALKLMDSLLIWGNRALIGLLNKSVAGLGKHANIGINLTCNNVRVLSLFLPKHFNGTPHKQYSCFHLSYSGGGIMKIWPG